MALTLLDELFINPYTTVSRAAISLGVTPPTAKKTIDLLEKGGILKESTGREWGRVWLARPILKIVEESGPIKGTLRA
jgi:Fic family protein